MKKNIFFISITVLVFWIVYHAWFSFSTLLTHGDWWFKYTETLTEHTIQYVWESSKNLGQFHPVIFRIPIDWLSSSFAFLFGIGSSGVDRLLFFWPQIFLLPLASFWFFNLLLRDKVAALTSAFIVAFNTYFLAITTQGHNLITVAFAFFILGLCFYHKALNEKHIRHFIFSALLFTLSGFIDLRVLYIGTFIIIGLTISYLYKNGFNKKALKKISLLGLVIILLNLIWLTPIILGGSSFGEGVLSRPLFGDQYWSLSYALTLMHPFWTGDEISWFTAQSIPWYFWIIPILAIFGLFISDKKPHAVTFAIIGLLGIFLTKQADAPFDWFYLWAYENIPGFNAFREASKFYILIILSYAFFIGYLVKWTIINFKQPIGKYALPALVCLLFFYNTTPLITGSIATMFIPKIIDSDYLILKNNLVEDTEFYRTYWAPVSNKWIFESAIHPRGSLLGLDSTPVFSESNGKANKKINYIISQDYSDSIFDAMTIKYISIPTSGTKTFENNFKDYGGDENPNIQNWYINLFDSTSYLKRINIGTEELVIYENEGYLPYIRTTSSLISYNSFNNLNEKYLFTVKTLRIPFEFVVPKSEKSEYPATGVFQLFENITLQNFSDNSIKQRASVVGENLNLYSYTTDEETNNVVQYDNVRISKLTEIGKVVSETETEFVSTPLTYSEDENTFSFTDSSRNLDNKISNGNLSQGLWKDEVGDCHNYDEYSDLDMQLVTDTRDGGESLELVATRHIACTGPAAIPVVGARTYLISFDYQSDQKTNAGFYIGWNGTTSTPVSEKIQIQDTGWNTFDKQIIAPYGATSASLLFYAYAKDGVTPIAVRYDNVNLIELPDITNRYFVVNDPQTNFIEPKEITFDLVNPTKKLVHIKGATTPFYLAMSESFHPQWQAQFNDEKVNGFFDSWVPFVKPNRIPDEHHFELNGFLNGWYIDTAKYCEENNLCTQNPDGSYDMELVLEFFPQRWFYLGLLISGTTFVSIIGYLVYDFIRRRKEKMELPDAQT